MPTTNIGPARAFCQVTTRVVTVVSGNPRVARTYQDAAKLYDWAVFLKGYYNNDPEYKEEFVNLHGLNRKERRRLESKTRQLRNRKSSNG